MATSISEAQKYITEAWSSSFDPASLSDAVLYELCFLLFQQTTTTIGIPSEKLRSFLGLVQAHYLNNPYHCWAHAIHVTFNAYRLSQNLRDSSTFTDIDQFILLFSAVIHDAHHPGHTNMVEIQSNSKLARLYNDQSVIENHSLAIAFDLAQQVQLFSDINETTRTTIRSRTVEMVLATDISPPSGKDRALLMTSKWRNAFGEQVTPETFTIETEEQRQQIQILLLRMADLGSAMQQFSIFGNWSKRLYIENNRSCGLTQEGHTNTQKPFMEYLCVPLVQEAAKYPILKNIDVIKNLLNENLKKWNNMDVASKCAAITEAYVAQPEKDEGRKKEEGDEKGNENGEETGNKNKYVVSE